MAERRLPQEEANPEVSAATIPGTVSRRLPPALEAKVYTHHAYASPVMDEADLLDWLYGTETVCPSCGRKWEGNCKDPDCVGGKLGTPGLVERVWKRLGSLPTTSPQSVHDVYEALRAELGEQDV